MKLKTFLVCFAAIAFLVLIRYGISGKFYYSFLLLNVMLAAMPLWFESLMRFVSRKMQGGKAAAANAVLGLAWLVFLPNAFYVLTDFMHLNNSVVVNEKGDMYSGTLHYTRGDALYVYDSLIIFVVTLLGAYVGGLALLHAYRFFKKSSGVMTANIALGGIMLLSGVGVYIGRYGRWNSWDIAYQPWNIVNDFALQAISPITRQRIIVTVLTIVIFELIAFYGVHWSQTKRQR